MSEFHHEYNKHITKSTIIAKVMQLVRESYDECAEEARKKNDSRKILDKNLQDADKLLKQLANLKANLRTLQKQIVLARFVTQEQKINIQSQTEKLMVQKYNETMVTEFVDNKKGFPVRVNPFLQSSFNSLQTQWENVSYLIQKIEAYKAAGCCSCSSNVKKSHQQYIIDLNKTLISLERQQIFWEYLSFCEAREGYYEIHDVPHFEDKSFEISLSQILEFILPEILKAQIQKEVIYKDVEVEKPVIVEKIVERVIQMEDKVGTAIRLLKLDTGRDVSRGIRILLEEVELGNSEAMTCLGSVYNDGQFVPMDKQKAFRYYEMAASKNNTEGWYRVGVMIEEGEIDKQEISLLRECQIKDQILNLNLKPNIVKAMYCYEQAGDKHGDALTDLGLFFVLLLVAIGFIYQKGVKIPQNEQELSPSEWYIYPDKIKAEQYYEKAKEIEHPRALNNLGLIILEEQKNQSVSSGMLLKAIKYFEQAHSLGNAKATVNLGICYEKGWGVNQNPQKAKSYFREAAERDDLNGKLLYSHYLIKDATDEQQEDYFQASNILQEIVRKNTNCGQAFFYLGFLYENGYGVTQDMKIAKNYYIKATQCNPPSSAAFTRLGDHYYQCLLILNFNLNYFKEQKSQLNDLSNQDKAVSFYQQAANLGNKTAMNNLGVMNQQGHFGRSNLIEAKKYYKAAGDKQGYLNLAILYSQMQLPQDKIKKNIIKASQLGETKAIDILNEQLQNQINEERLIEEIQLENPEIIDKQLFFAKQQSQYSNKVPVVQSVYQSSIPKKQFKEQQYQNSLEDKLNKTCKQIFLQYSLNNQQFIHLTELKHILQLILNELEIKTIITDQTISQLHQNFNETNEITTHINYQELLLIVKTFLGTQKNELNLI